MSDLSPDHVDASLVSIVPYTSRYRADFARITLAWYQEYHFELEPIDERLLSAPEDHVLASGGAIWFAICCDDEAIGTIGIRKNSDQDYELIKLGVSPPQYRGQHTGKRLVSTALAFAHRRGGQRVILYTHSKLANACRLYRHLGFLEQRMPDGCPYRKANVFMALSL
jgi:ribosomal protein S18 acetylase RimI-like enzyme